MITAACASVVKSWAMFRQNHLPSILPRDDSSNSLKLIFDGRKFFASKNSERSFVRQRHIKAVSFSKATQGRNQHVLVSELGDCSIDRFVVVGEFRTEVTRNVTNAHDLAPFKNAC
jgi:hypothetical protein